jgi:hypothetical protein
MDQNKQMLLYTKVSTVFIGTNLVMTIINFIVNVMRTP